MPTDKRTDEEKKHLHKAGQIKNFMCNIPKRNDEDRPLSNLNRSPIVRHEEIEEGKTSETHEYAFAWKQTSEKCSILKDVRSNPRMRTLMKIIGSCFVIVTLCLLVVCCRYEKLNNKYEEVVQNEMVK